MPDNCSDAVQAETSEPGDAKEVKSIQFAEPEDWHGLDATSVARALRSSIAKKSQHLRACAEGVHRANQYFCDVGC